MRKLKDLLNQIGDFHFQSGKDKVDFIGTLVNQDNHIIIQARIEKKNLDFMKQKTPFQIWGEISGTNVTLLDNYIITSFYHINSGCVEISIDPSEIVIGRGYVSDIFVTNISASIGAMNHMFSDRVFNENVCFTKENPTVLSFAYPEDIEAMDTDGTLRLYRGFSHGWSRHGIEYRYLPYIDYAFSKPTRIRDAIAKIACARNLLSFFDDYYLPLENLLFSDEQTDNAKNFPGYCDCQLYLNHKEDIEVPEEPFLIMTNKFSENFSEVWTNWLKFYADSIYIPTLFYEIICNRSTRINRFLNLTQAIELYSVHYRDELAKGIAQADGCRKKQLPLKYRIEDVLVQINGTLEISKEKRRRLARAISNDRNFFTHYNEQRYTEPSFEEISAANRVLRYVLLSIVYKVIGIRDDYIKECKNRLNYSTFERDVSVILKERQDINYMSWTE